MNIPTRLLRLSLIPLAVAAELLLMLACWVLALMRLPSAAKRLMDFAFDVLPDKRWYVG